MKMTTRSAMIFSSIGFLAAAHNVWSDGFECKKISQQLCAEFRQAVSTADTFSVKIGFYYPVRDTACRGVDPHQDTSGICIEKYDSAYFAGLKAQAETLFTKFELWDARHPEVRLTPPSEGQAGIQAILATKATLLLIDQEPYISSIEEWEEALPLAIQSRPTRAIKFGKTAGRKYRLNGREEHGYRKLGYELNRQLGVGHGFPP